MTENESLQAVCTALLAALLTAGPSGDDLFGDPGHAVNCAHALLDAAQSKAKTVPLEVFKDVGKTP